MADYSVPPSRGSSPAMHHTFSAGTAHSNDDSVEEAAMNVHAFLQHQQNAIDLSNYKHRNQPSVHKNSSPNTGVNSSTTALTKTELKVDNDSLTAFSNPGLHDFHRENINKSDTPECPTQQHYSLSYHPSLYYWKPAFPGQGSPPIRPQLVNLCLFYNPGELIKEDTKTAFDETHRTLEEHDEMTGLSTGSLGDFPLIKTQTFHPPRQYSADAEPLNLSLRKRELSYLSSSRADSERKLRKIAPKPPVNLSLRERELSYLSSQTADSGWKIAPAIIKKDLSEAKAVHLHPKKCINEVDTSASRSYICEVCRKSFNQRYNLNAHRKTVHSQPKLFFCKSGGCYFATSSSENLKEHVRLFHFNLQCPKCEMCFSLPYNFAHHINKHHSTANKTVFCKMTNQEALEKQELRHKFPIMYSCNHCSNMYKSRAWMEKHLNREHPTGKLVDFTEIQMERPVLDTSQ